ncbi:MAG: tetratricopeptide repeat protein [Acidimicrobiia bacterium]|nr:tetratricopeptide repeat protein [Acidimicrobiia bacterium]
MREELDRLGGTDADKLHARVLEAADAYSAGRERDAIRILEPVRDRVPGAAGVRELLGLSYYRAGRYRAARQELVEFARLSRSTDQHPVLMDCYRAERRFQRVDELWEELRAVSPGPALVVEGRIVAAGALADQGEFDKAIRLLDQRARKVRSASPEDLRLLYALADLHERSGDLPRARALFERVVEGDRDLTDAPERLAALA